MALPLKKIKNSIYLNLSRRLYNPDSIEKSLQVFRIPGKKIRQINKDYVEIKLDSFDLNSTLEFSNYLLHLNR